MLTQNAPVQLDEPEQEMLLMFGEDPQFAEDPKQRFAGDRAPAGAAVEDLPSAPQPVFFKYVHLVFLTLYLLLYLVLECISMVFNTIL